MAIRSFSAIASSMQSFIRGKNPTLNTAEGTILNDIVISAPGRELERLYATVDSVSQDQALSTASDTALESMAQNFGLARKQARKSQGFITFFSTQVPISDITISVGTIVSTPPAPEITTKQFIVTRSVTMYASLASIYLNASTNYYEITTSIEAVSAGIDSNVGVQAITSISSAISGISGCYNATSTSGGIDTESSDSLRARIALKLTGTGIATADGILNVVSAQDGVADAVILSHGDSPRLDAGAVDVYVKGTTNTFKVDVVTVYTGNYADITLAKQPVISDSVAIQTSGSGNVSTSFWELQKDTGVYGGSINGLDKISWITPISSDSGSVVVSYSYNSLIETLQNLFTQTNKDILNTDLLVLQATDIPIDITASVKVLPGFDFLSVSAVIQDEVSTLLSEQGIGQELQQADVARTILNVPGVDDVTLPFTVFQSSDATILADSVTGNITIPANSYVSVGTININQIV